MRETCYCHDKGLTPLNCVSDPEVPLLNRCATFGSCSADQSIDRLTHIATLILMGSVKTITLSQESPGFWDFTIQTHEGDCAAAIAHYLFQED